MHNILVNCFTTSVIWIDVRVMAGGTATAKRAEVGFVDNLKCSKVIGLN